MEANIQIHYIGWIIVDFSSSRKNPSLKVLYVLKLLLTIFPSTHKQCISSCTVFLPFVDFQVVLSSRLLSKNLKIKNYNFGFCFVWVWNLVVDIAGGKETEGVWEQGVEENIWA